MFDLLHNYLPQPVLFQVGQLSVRWYGFLMVVSIILGIFFVIQLGKKYQIQKDQIFDMSFYAILSGLLGARIYYVLYSWSYYKNHLSEILKIWHGGLAIHGVILGGFISVYVFSKLKKISFGLLADIIAPALALGQTIGRWGNYFNQEIFGKPSNLPWAIPITETNRPAEYAGNQYFHPTFLYESILNLLVFVILFSLHKYRLNKNKKYQNGNIFLVYLILYSLIRFSMEFLRTDNSPIVFGIRWAQFFSAVIFFLATAFLIYRKYFKH